MAELSQWMPWCHPDYSLAESQEWIGKQIAAFTARDEFHFAIVSGNERILGACGLNSIQWDNRRANLGYWVRTSESRHGIATQAARLLADWALANTGLNRLEILVAIQNIASLRVAAKIGGVWEGVLPGRLQVREAMHDAIVFSIIRRDP